MKTKKLLLVLATLLTSATVGAQEMTELSCNDFRPTDEAKPLSSVTASCTASSRPMSDA